MGEPARISDTAASALNGGHTATWTPRGRLSPSRSPVASTRASATVPCIFQLPTTSGVFIGVFSSGRVRQRLDARQLPPLEALEERAGGGWTTYASHRC